MMQIRKLAASKSYREESGLYLGDGEKLLEEAVRWRAPLHTVVCTERAKLPPLPEGVRLVQVPEDVMRSVSPMETPQGALFLLRREPPALLRKLEGRGYLLLDGVQDPGNVGTILRTADAFDSQGVFLLPGCADAYHPKTVRATMGAIFRRPVYSCTLEELTALLRRSGLPLYGAALRADTVDVRQLSRQAAVLAIGSEGRGLSESVLAVCDKTVKIPMSERCESLNAAIAAAVLLWEWYR